MRPLRQLHRRRNQEAAVHKCGEPYVREEVIERKFSEVLGRLSFDDEVLSWVREALSQSHADQKRDHELAIARLKGEHERLQQRIHAMYVDKLDGRIDEEFFDRMSTEWRGEQDRCLLDIERHSAADQSYLEEGIRVLELARNAQRLFDKQEPREKRRLLQFVVSNCSWKGGELTFSLRQPFDLLADTNARATELAEPEGADLAKRAIWLGGRDSNPDNMLQRHASYRWTTSQYRPRCSDEAESSIISGPRLYRQAHEPAGSGPV